MRAMSDAQECHRKAEALATLAEMFPENAERYRAKEDHWRRLEAEARSPKTRLTKESARSA
jgi:hypothetical protein